MALAKGEFLPQLRYEDWMTSHQLAVQEEVRRLLMPIAAGAHAALDPLLGCHAAAVLVAMDPLDENANLVLATQLAITGRRPAARRSLERYVTMVSRELGDSPGEDVFVALGALTRRAGPSMPT